LQQEQDNAGYSYPYPPADIGSNTLTVRVGESWPKANGNHVNEDRSPDDKSTRKKTGLAKIWGLVTGTSKSVSKYRNGPPLALTKSEDDSPLAPPPSLSYLVDRDYGGSSRRHVSTPSLPSTTLAYPASTSSQTVSPPTAPSSVLPSPTFSRVDAVDSRINGVYDPECELVIDETAKSKTMSNLALSSTNQVPNSRPQTTVTTNEKALPPLPAESSVGFPSESRPQTMFTFDPRHSDLTPPRPQFQAETRRQSFAGLESRPHTRSVTYSGSPPPIGEYNEFGISRSSLGWWEDSRRVQQQGVGSMETDGTSKTLAKRRNKFGLTSIFGKKDRGDLAAGADHESILHSMSSLEHDTRGFAASVTKRSIKTRRAILELVDQDPDFVAYRYPSNDQRLDLFQP
jgi:hypothetical protein